LHEPSNTPPPTAAPGAARVLIVEDKRDTAEALRYALAFKRYDVHVAYDGQSALAAAAADAPDVVLCDLGLPDMSGHTLAGLLRQLPAMRHAVLVAISGLTREVDVARAKDAGFDEHLAKPPQLDQLFRIIDGARRGQREC